MMTSRQHEMPYFVKKLFTPGTDVYILILYGGDKMDMGCATKKQGRRRYLLT